MKWIEYNRRLVCFPSLLSFPFPLKKHRLVFIYNLFYFIPEKKK